MPHLSKQKLDSQLHEKLFDELQKLIANTSARESTLVVTTLLTETERLMIAKRFASAFMFSKGYSQYQVWKTLKISPSTAQRLFNAYENGAYSKLVKIAERNSHEKFWDTVELILRGGMPSMGKDRWKILDKK